MYSVVKAYDYEYEDDDEDDNADDDAAIADAAVADDAGRADGADGAGTPRMSASPRVRTTIGLVSPTLELEIMRTHRRSGSSSCPASPRPSAGGHHHLLDAADAAAAPRTPTTPSSPHRRARSASMGDPDGGRPRSLRRARSELHIAAPVERYAEIARELAAADQSVKAKEKKVELAAEYGLQLLEQLREAQEEVADARRAQHEAERYAEIAEAQLKAIRERLARLRKTYSENNLQLQSEVESLRQKMGEQAERHKLSQDADLVRLRARERDLTDEVKRLQLLVGDSKLEIQAAIRQRETEIRRTVEFETQAELVVVRQALVSCKTDLARAQADLESQTRMAAAAKAHSDALAGELASAMEREAVLDKQLKQLEAAHDHMEEEWAAKYGGLERHAAGLRDSLDELEVRHREALLQLQHEKMAARSPVLRPMSGTSPAGLSPASKGDGGVISLGMDLNLPGHGDSTRPLQESWYADDTSSSSGGGDGFSDASTIPDDSAAQHAELEALREQVMRLEYELAKEKQRSASAAADASNHEALPSSTTHSIDAHVFGRNVRRVDEPSSPSPLDGLRALLLRPSKMANGRRRSYSEAEAPSTSAPGRKYEDEDGDARDGLQTPPDPGTGRRRAHSFSISVTPSPKLSTAAVVEHSPQVSSSRRLSVEYGGASAGDDEEDGSDGMDSQHQEQEQHQERRRRRRRSERQVTRDVFRVIRHVRFRSFSAAFSAAQAANAPNELEAKNPM